MDSIEIGWSTIVGKKIFDEQDTFRPSLEGKNVLEIGSGTGGLIGALPFVGVQQYVGISLTQQNVLNLVNRLNSLSWRLGLYNQSESNQIPSEELDGMFTGSDHIIPKWGRNDAIPEVPPNEIELGNSFMDLDTYFTYVFSDRQTRIMETLEKVPTNYGVIFTNGVVSQATQLFGWQHDSEGKDVQKPVDTFLFKLFEQIARISPISYHSGISPYINGNQVTLSDSLRVDARYDCKGEFMGTTRDTTLYKLVQK